MKTINRTVVSLLLAVCAGASAQQQTPAATPPQASAATPHYDPRGTTQSVCMAPAVGACPSCQVSCSSGQFALCSPGAAMTPQAGSACAKAPECRCH